MPFRTVTLLGDHQFSSADQPCPTLCDPMDCSAPVFPVHHQLPELAQPHVHHFTLCRPLLLLPSIFPTIRVFSNESVLCIRWPEYWSFSFSFSPSNEYSELISLLSKRLLRVFSNTRVQKYEFFGAQLSLWSNSHIHT